jgi:FAD/FMN-containing dehydrogenase
MTVKTKLREIVGPENFSDDAEVLNAYSTDFSLVPAGVPNYVVKPKTVQEVQKIVQLANKNLLPVVPTSSAVHFHGAAIPKQGGVVVDLTRMNRILEVDEFNRRVRLEVGVNWEKATRELAKKGFRLMMPLAPHPMRSPVIDHLEREVITNTVYDYGEPLQSMEVVWPTGEIFRTGSASVAGYPDSPSKGSMPAGPGLDFYRLLQGAQGTMGIVTWANLKIEYLPAMDRVLLAPVDDLEYTIDFLHRILKVRIGQECLLLDNTELAALAAEKWPDDFESLRATLPPWTLVLVMSAMARRPEEKLKYEQNLLDEIIKNEFSEIKLSSSLPGFPGMGKKLLARLRQPWPKNKPYWKHRYLGGYQSIFFITRPGLAPQFIELMEAVAAQYGYPVDDIGGYIQPIEHNRACQVQFDIFYDPTSEVDLELVGSLYRDAIGVLASEGALFTRPYGELADLVYGSATGYATALRRVKKIFDPNNIMNPGTLCY